MKILLFLASSVLALSFCSCKSVGYHVEGNSTIVRNDTVHVTVVGDKPVVVDQIVR